MRGILCFMWGLLGSWAAVAVAIWVGFSVASGGQESPPLSASDIADGLRLFLQKGNCQACHGWAGDGRKTDSQMPDGANLRESRLGRDALVLTVKCGRPGRSMPAFDKFAYSDGRCYDMKLPDLKSLGLS